MCTYTVDTDKKRIITYLEVILFFGLKRVLYI